ncbi:hypothetical protein J3458_000106 [Metarhizium acridum]|uniref:uncharacterized protein n=1 Tax=Metarhizium acridum TaxID=92637 RepID=UPI001C6CB3D5|nr:hypothetical protein J3458_000106 [Metarhizium acridum]
MEKGQVFVGQTDCRRIPTTLATCPVSNKEDMKAALEPQDDERHYNKVNSVHLLRTRHQKAEARGEPPVLFQTARLRLSAEPKVDGSIAKRNKGAAHNSNRSEPCLGIWIFSAVLN